MSSAPETINMEAEARRVECVGRAFIRGAALQHRGLEATLGCNRSCSGDDSADSVVFDDDVDYLRSLDPKEWKDQDHYAVLGIKSLRFSATDDDVKRAYRFKVLRHHPDKRKAQGEEVRNDDDYFTCITKAYETLGTTVKRRSYDSVDPDFDDSIPTGIEPKSDFYETFGPFFELNARWSEKRNTPSFGDDASTREQVDKFYNFWYNFESWREYSYHDEEEKEKGQDREERRWIEKQNKSVRAKKKKEEMARIRSLVDIAYSNDPRIVRFKQEDKDKKLAVKKARQVTLYFCNVRIYITFRY